MSLIDVRALCLEKRRAGITERVAVLDGRVHDKSPWQALNRNYMRQQMSLIAVLDGRVRDERCVTGLASSRRVGGRLGRPCAQREMCHGTHLEQTRGWPSWTAVCATRDVSRDVS